AKRQLISKVGIELMLEVIGPQSPVHIQVKRIQDGRRLIRAGGSQESGLDIQEVRKGVIGLESESAGGALGQRDGPRMVATVGVIEPALHGSYKRIRTSGEFTRTERNRSRGEQEG